MTDKDVVGEFLHELDVWERAYPLSAFPEPDLGKAAELLEAGGMTLDAISASNMRYVVSQIAPSARAAIAAYESAVGEAAKLGTVSLTSFDGHCVRIDFPNREDAERMYAALTSRGE
jgi:hypothetical protein